MSDTVISNDIIQGALVAHLKTITALTTKLSDYGSDSTEIRENQWKGADFLYPAIRVQIRNNNPIQGYCAASDINISIIIFTEDQSSAHCNELSGIIGAYLKDRQFGSTFQGSAYHFSMGRMNLVPAMDVGSLLWRAEVVISGSVSQQA